MDKPKKLFVNVKEFPKHTLQLLLSLPPHEPYSDSHDAAYNCNLLIMRNGEGHTRVYSMGMEVFDTEDLRQLFSFGNTIA